MQEESGKDDHRQWRGTGDDRADVRAGEGCAEELEWDGEDITGYSTAKVEPPFAAMGQSWPLDKEEDEEQDCRTREPQDDEVEKRHAGQSVAADHEGTPPDGSRRPEVEQPPGVAFRWVHRAARARFPSGPGCPGGSGA